MMGRQLWIALMMGCVAVGTANAQEEAAETMLFDKPLDDWVRDAGAGDASARRDSLIALRAAGPKAKAAVPTLVKSLMDPDTDVRRYAAFTLGSIGPDAKDAVPALARGLQDREVGVRYACCYAAGQIGPAAKDTVDLLKDLREGENRIVAIRASEAIYLIDKDRQTNEVDFLSDLFIDEFNQEPWRVEAMVTLAKLDPKAAKKAMPFLRQLYQGQEPALQVRMLDATARIESEQAKAMIPALRAFMNDVNETERVRIEAAQAVARIDKEQSAEALKLLARYVTRGTPSVRVLAADAMREIDPEAAKKVGVP